MNDISRDREQFLEAAARYPEAFKRQLGSASRRGFLAAGVGLGAAGLLGACATKTAHSSAGSAGSGSGSSSAAPSEGKEGADKSDTEKIVNFSNWVSYIDVDPNDKNKRPTLDNFKAETGITVDYTEDVNSNDDFFAKIHQQLAAGQDTGRDLMVLSDWMIGKLRQMGYLEPLNLANIPNFKDLLPDTANPAYDPNRKHTVPWALGFTLMGVNLKSAGLTKDQAQQLSIKDMMTDAKYKGKVGYFAEMEDGVGFGLLATGADPAKFTDDQFNAAVAYIQKARDNNQIRQFTGNDYINDLTNGNYAMCMAYSGDIAQIDDPNIVWVVPTEGMLWFTDNMCIPAMASHKTNAEKFMNYMLEPKVGAALDDYISYIPSMQGADTAMKTIDPNALQNQLIFPDAATKAKAHEFQNLDLKTLDKYVSQFKDVTG
ncbi:polyamine ABC transporter substrate-binding protein [Catenulispora pinisilvae]|uniref:polyamine ABC transporter substrate-binding protein n=1 Tax=Catenulispora pinisilvae TaxID=2705253 RepID=UPI0018918AD2|nr:spermidine/putrescine ABC transporter substrate-binding protein [Catenulispora pinisilvae]